MRKPIRILGRVLLACIAMLMLIAFISIVCGLQSAAHAQALPSVQKGGALHSLQDLDHVVAVVNQEVITERELAARVRLITYRVHRQSLASKKSAGTSKMASASPVLPPQDVLRKQVLEHLVLQHVQLQKAKEEGISPEDTAVTQALENLARNENLSLAAYRRQLESAGFSWSAIQREMKNELSIEALRQKEVDRKVTVSDADVDQYMANPGSANELTQAAAQSPVARPTMEQVHVRHILIRIHHGTSEKSAQQKLLELRRKILAGADFGELARTVSEDGSASQGGDLGWIALRDTVPEFAQAASVLKENAISEPVRTEYGYHLIQVLGRRAPDVKNTEIDKQRDIARQLIGMRKAERAYARWLRELHDSATVQYKLQTP